VTFYKWCQAVFLHKKCDKLATPNKRKLAENKSKLETFINKDEEMIIKIDKIKKLLDDQIKKQDKINQIIVSYNEEKMKAITLIKNARVLGQIKELYFDKWNEMIEITTNKLV